MTIIEDTRQKTKGGPHALKHKTWREQDVKVVRSKLIVGDYCRPPTVSIDTKKNLNEIGNNLLGSPAEKKRVLAEIKLARDIGTELVFLVEQDSIKSDEDLLDISIQLGNGRIASGKDLLKKMRELRARYGCKFMFCAPSEAAHIIDKILFEERKEQDNENSNIESTK